METTACKNTQACLAKDPNRLWRRCPETGRGFLSRPQCATLQAKFLPGREINHKKRYRASHVSGSLGGTIPEGSSDIVLFGDTAIKIREPDGDYNGEYSSNVGTAIDHIAFSVPDVQAKATELGEAGITVKRWSNLRRATRPGDDRLEMLAGVLSNPWGTRIGILKDDDLMGFHHVHIKSPDPKGTAEWYSKVLGVEVGRYKNLSQSQIYALRFTNIYIFVQRSIRPLKPSVGSSVEHFNMKLPKFEAELKRLKAMDIEFLHGLYSHTGHMRATIVGPDGLTVELMDNLSD